MFKRSAPATVGAALAPATDKRRIMFDDKVTITIEKAVKQHHLRLTSSGKIIKVELSCLEPMYATVCAPDDDGTAGCKGEIIFYHLLRRRDGILLRTGGYVHHPSALVSNLDFLYMKGRNLEGFEVKTVFSKEQDRSVTFWLSMSSTMPGLKIGLCLVHRKRIEAKLWSLPTEYSRYFASTLPKTQKRLMRVPKNELEDWPGGIDDASRDASFDAHIDLLTKRREWDHEQ